MALQLPDRNEIFTAILQEFADRLPEANTGEGEPYWVLAQIIATAIWSCFQPISYVSDQIYPTSSDTEFLVRHGNARKIPRKLDAAAKGFALISATVAGATQPAASTLSDSSGQQYATDVGVTFAAPGWLRTSVLAFDPKFRDRFLAVSVTGMVVGDVFFIAGLIYCIKALPGGTSVVVYGYISGDPTGQVVASAAASARVPITAAFTGSAGNLPFRSGLTLDSPGTDVLPAVTVLEMGGGADIEAEEAWADRLEEIDAEYPAGGNRSQLVGWAKGLSTKQERDDNMQKEYALGVERAFCYPLFRGLGTGDLVVQGVSGARHLSGAVIAAIQNYINPALPTDANPGMVAMGADIIVEDFTELAIAIVLDIYGGPGYGPDYSYAPFVVAAGSTPIRINTTASPVGRVAPGNRIAFYVGPPLWFIMGRAVNVDAGGFSVSPALPAVPPAGVTVYPGSSLIEPTVERILAMLDSLGPGDTFPASRYPAPSTQNPDRLNRSLINKVVMEVEGMLNVTITAPGADVLPVPKQQVTLSLLEIRHLPVT